MRKLLPILMLSALIFGCALPEKQAVFMTMGTVMDLKANAASQAPLDEAQRLIEDYDKQLNPEGEGHLGMLNRGGSVAWEDAANIRSLLALGLEARALTGGAFSPGMLKPVRAWGFGPDAAKGMTPSSEAIEAFLQEEAQLDALHLPDDGVQDVFTLPDGVMLDFGGIAKGWLGDRLVELMAREGVASAILSLGGNVVCIGAPQGGSTWRVGVAHPRGEGVYATVEGRNMHVVTSADDQRFYFDETGQRICHIIDPRTMHPASAGLISVTVITPFRQDGGAWADMLSTAAFVLGSEAGIALLENADPPVAYVAMMTDGRVLTGGDNTIAQVTAP